MMNIVGLEIKRTNLFVTTVTDKGCFLERLLTQKKKKREREKSSITERFLYMLINWSMLLRDSNIVGRTKRCFKGSLMRRYESVSSSWLALEKN